MLNTAARRRRFWLATRASVAAVPLVAAMLVATPPPAAASTTVLGGQLYASGGDVTVTILPSDAGFTSELWIESPGTPHEIGIRTQVGLVADLGTFPAGQELIFSIHEPRDGGNIFYTGPASRNADGIVHDQVIWNSPTDAIVEFEDFFGGGDRDYNDAIFEMKGGITQNSAVGPTADAGANQTVPEGAPVTLDASKSTPGSAGGSSAAPVSYSWTQTSGPAVTLSDPTSSSPTFVAPDEGSYGFTVTVTNAAGQTSTASTTVAATDVGPGALTPHGSTTVLGDSSVLGGSFAAPAPGDSYTASVDWGDGSNTTSAPVSVTAGIGTVVASHTYAATGSYTATATVSSDGGQTQSAAATEIVKVRPPSATVWANRSNSTNVLTISGTGNQITGPVHSNADLVVTGSNHTITGASTYGTTSKVQGSKNTLSPPPTQSAVGPAPATAAVGDFRPGGTAAVAAGSSYFDETPACSGGSFNPNPGPLADGLYWVPCDVQLAGSDLQAKITIASTGTIHVSGARDTFTPFVSGLMFVSSDATNGIQISGSSNALSGDLIDKAGPVRFDGSRDSLTGGVVGDTVAIAGASNTIDGSHRPAPTLTNAILVAAAGRQQNHLGVDAADAIPGDALTYTATVANIGVGVTVAGVVAATNSAASAGSVSSYGVTLQTRDSNGTWATIATASPSGSTGGLNSAFTPAPASGVTYPSGADTVSGTTVAPNSVASWAYRADLTLTPAAWGAAQANGLRVITTLGTTGSGMGTDTGSSDVALSGIDGSLSSVTVSLAGPTGVKTLDSSSVAGLASIAPGASVTAAKTVTLPTVDGKGTIESDARYLARLGALDGVPLSAAAASTATTAAGQTGLTAGSATTTRHVPAVRLSASPPATATTGDHLDIPITLTNPSTAPATGLVVTAQFGSTPVTIAGVPSTLAPGATVTLTEPVDIPLAMSSATLTNLVTLGWADGNSNHYGTDSSSSPVQVTNPVSITAVNPAFVPLSGSAVTITGTGFTGATAVKFGSTDASSFTVGSPTQITATAPPGSASTVKVTVTTPHGQASGGSLTYLPPPTVTGFAGPADGAAAGGYGLQINGTNLRQVSAVYFGTTAALINGSFGTSVSVRVPAGTGTVHVTVVTPGGTSAATDADLFTFVPRPVVTAVTPSAGPTAGGTPVTISGSGFTAATAVQFGPHLVGSFHVVSDSTITTFAPAGSDTVNVIVTSDGGASATSAADQYTYTAAPTVTAISPAAGPQAGGTIVTITGTNLMGACCVQFGSNAASAMHVDSNTQITATAPGGNGTVDVTVTSAGGTSATSAADRYTYANGPVITGLSPTSGATAGGTTVTISGTDFTGASSVSFGSVAAASYSVDSNTQITAVSPPGAAGSVDVSVTTPGGTTPTVAADKFTYGTGGGGGTGGPGPVIGDMSPADGSRVTDPTPITETITPPSGDTITDWTVTVQSVDGGATETVASGTGTPPSPLGTLDPTTLENGTYDVTTTASDSAGGTASTTTTVIIDGQLKPGRYVADYQDLSIPVTGFTLAVQRHYDSIDTRSGDFGVGWSLALSSVRVQANRDLGAGGWSGDFSCHFGSCNETYGTSAAHTVTVTYPDGHQDIFDFTPKGLAGEQDLATAAFTPRAGTTSTLQALGDTDLIFGEDGNFYDQDTGDIYSPTQYQVTTHDGRVFVVDVKSGLVSATDTNGNTLTVTSGGVTSSSGSALTFTRDAQGRITKATSSDGRSVSYRYDAAGDLVGYTDPDGNTATYTYDSNHHMLSQSGAGSPIRTMTYTPDGRLASITDGDGNTATLNIDPSLRTETLTDATGKLTTILSFDALGDVVQKDEIAGGDDRTTKYTYDAQGHQLTVTNPLGKTTTHTYDGAGDLTSSTDPLNRTTSYTYDADGHILTKTLPSGVVAESNSYDARGNLTSLTRPSGATYSYAYDPAGLMTSITDPLHRTVTVDYDPAGRPEAITDATGDVTHIQTAATGQVTSTTDALGASTSYGYDNNGDLTSTTNALGQTVSYSYDTRGDLVSTTDPAGHTTTYTYDAAARVKSMVDRNGGQTTYSYDAGGRLTKVALSDGSTTTYGYDGFGELTTAVNATETLGFSYNDVGQVISATSAPTSSSDQEPSVTLNYRYDAAGEPGSVSGPAGTITYGYSADALLNHVMDPFGSTFEITHDANGQRTGVTRPNGVSDTYSYDAADELTGIDSTDSAGTSIGFDHYTYTANGLRSTLTNPDGTTNYGYDADGQLVSASYPAASGLANESFSYDRIGDQNQASQSYDNAGRLTEDAASSYVYDKEGDLLARTDTSTGKITHYAWNPAHQLMSVTTPNGSQTTFGYDPLGRRVDVTTPAGRVHTVYDGTHPLVSYDANGTLMASYVYGAGANEQLDETVGGQTYYYLHDALGSVTALTTSAGAVADGYRYTAFGQADATGSVPNPFTYIGAPADPGTGLVYLGARYLDTGSGRFLSEDPVPANSLYVYSLDDPTNLTDPTGRDEAEDELAAQAGSFEVDDLQNRATSEELQAFDYQAGKALSAAFEQAETYPPIAATSIARDADTVNEFYNSLKATTVQVSRLPVFRVPAPAGLDLGSLLVAATLLVQGIVQSENWIAAIRLFLAGGGE